MGSGPRESLNRREEPPSSLLGRLVVCVDAWTISTSEDSLELPSPIHVVVGSDGTGGWLSVGCRNRFPFDVTPGPATDGAATDRAETIGAETTGVSSSSDKRIFVSAEPLDEAIGNGDIGNGSAKDAAAIHWFKL
jgi:hypothetical protein